MGIFNNIKSLFSVNKDYRSLEDIGFDDEDDPRGRRKHSRREAEAMLVAHASNSLLRTPIHCIAEDSACVDWFPERVDKDGIATKFNKFTARTKDEKALCSLLERPHPRLTWKKWIYLLVTWQELTGIAAFRMMKDGKGCGPRQKPDRLQPIPPHHIVDVPGKDNPNWTIKFPIIDAKGVKRLEEFYVPGDQMLSFYDPDLCDPLGNWTGKALAVDDEVSLAEAQSKWTLRTFLHGTFLGNIIALPNLGERKDEIIRNWRAKYSGYLNAGKDYFVDSSDAESGKVQVIPLSKDPAQMNLVEQRHSTRDLMGTAWQVPPERMGIITDANRSTIDVADFHQQSKNVLPRLKDIRAELNWRLVPRFADNLQFNYDNPVKESETDRQTRIFRSVEKGLITINEARDELGRELVDPNFGDRFQVPINNVALIATDGSRLLAEILEPTPGQDDIDEADGQGVTGPKNSNSPKDKDNEDPELPPTAAKKLLSLIKKR